MKFFNTTGPINPDEHYYIPNRLNEPEIKSLIEQKKYFILHAPRQSGKTTGIKAFVHILNQENKYKALYVNVESAQAMRSKVFDAMKIILANFKSEITKTFGSSDEESLLLIEKRLTSGITTGNDLFDLLEFWSSHSSKPIILFIDEIDSLVGDTLISVLRQLRSGYVNRPTNFPQSVCLVGVRDVRDYRIWSDEHQAIVLGGSAFNIKAKSLTLPDFTPEQLKDLYLQHTQETGQKFTDEAIDYAFYLTQGQPWLTNALAYEACFEMVTDRTKPITKEITEQAKETLILHQDTHLDVLIDRLNEPRVRTIIDAIITGSIEIPYFNDDDLKYVVDLGLIKRDAKNIWIANPIYQEVLPRALANTIQSQLSGRSVDYVTAQGTLDMKKLMQKFVQFYQENSAIWLEKFAYKESGPHLLLMAFLQRIINGGGSIHREYALGRKRVDLLIVWPQSKQRIVIELKLWRSAKTLPEGLEQTAEYMDTSKATEGHLVIFDRISKKPWSKKIYHKKKTVDHKIIDVWGM